jgi:hypothetical protein
MITAEFVAVSVVFRGGDAAGKRGAVFTIHDADSIARVVVVNERSHPKDFHRNDAVGRRMRFVWRGQGKKPKSSAWSGYAGLDAARHHACTNPFFNIPAEGSPCFSARVPMRM